ncbi:MAG: glycosyltransferase family 2 protein [Roseiarcus sp.]|jgi:glycosyltransferase involved in cell wall biosynthesis
MENQAASGHRAADGKALTIVVPVFNEESHVAILAEKLTQELDRLSEAWSVLFVDDGSQDGTLARLRELARADSRFGALALSRNFGKEAALAAGLRHASGDAVIVMDADLQHPPEAIPRFVEAWRAGAKVVFGQRQNRVGESAARRGLSRVFYRLFRLLSDTRIPRGATDFVLFDRQAADALNALGERCRFSKGLYAWIGFRSAAVPFRVGEREGSNSHWSLIKLLRYALDGVASFSSLPLKVWSYVGLAVSTGAIAYAVYFAIQTLVLGVDVPGFPSLIISITFFAGVQLISLGVLGEYLGRVYQEVKGRPLFVVAERIGAPSAAPNAAAKTES